MLDLLCGPANSGKIRAVLDGFLTDAQSTDAWLVLPTSADVRRARHEVLERAGGVLVGSRIGTLLDLARWVAGAESLGELPRGARTAAVRRVLERAGDAFPERRWPGFAHTAGRLLERRRPAHLRGESTGDSGDQRDWDLLLRTWADFLAERDLTDAAGIVAAATRRLEADAVETGPIWVYGFDDLDEAQQDLLLAASRRARVTVTVPFQPGRAVFARRAAMVDRLLGAGARLDESGSARFDTDELCHLAAGLFEATQDPWDGATPNIELHECSGRLRQAEAVAAACLAALADGVGPEQIACLSGSPAAARPLLEEVLARHGIPATFHTPRPLSHTPAGRAVAAAFAAASRHRGDAPQLPPMPQLAPLVQQPAPIEQLATARPGSATLAAAHGLLAGIRPESTGDARILGSVWTAIDELAAMLEDELGIGDLADLLEELSVPAPDENRPGSVAVAPITRTRTDRFHTVILFDLQSGGFGAAEEEDPDLRPLLVRERAYVAVTRPTHRLVAIRCAADDRGDAVAPHPLWRELRRLFPDVDPQPWPNIELAPQPGRPMSVRGMRLLAAELLAEGRTPEVPARCLDEGSTWMRRHPLAPDLVRLDTLPAPQPLIVSAGIAELARARTEVAVTELETFAGCPARWALDHLILPRDTREQTLPGVRGSITHQVLCDLADAIATGGTPTRDEVLDQVNAAATRLDPDGLMAAPALDRLARAIHRFVSAEPAVDGTIRAELALGELGADAPMIGPLRLKGRIDRVDLLADNTAVIHDYKTSSLTSSWSANQLVNQGRLQLGLYLDALDGAAVGTAGSVAAQAAVYRAVLAEPATGTTRGIVPKEAAAEIPGLTRAERRTREELDEVRADIRALAESMVEQMRAGEVPAAPRGGKCPSWCTHRTICRIAEHDPAGTEPEAT